jgi:hypothetical protein
VRQIRQAKSQDQQPSQANRSVGRTKSSSSSKQGISHIKEKNEEPRTTKLFEPPPKMMLQLLLARPSRSNKQGAREEEQEQSAVLVSVSTPVSHLEETSKNADGHVFDFEYVATSWFVQSRSVLVPVQMIKKEQTKDGALHRNEE